MIVRLIMVWLCNYIDTLATLHLSANYVGTELNPISVIFLQSPLLFVAFKLTVMTIAVMFLWWRRDWKLCKVISWILFIEYILVAIYYVIVYSFLIWI